MKRRPESARRPWDKRRGDLGHILRTARRSRWLSLRETALTIGSTSANTLSRIERGHTPSAETYERVCDWIEAVTHVRAMSRSCDMIRSAQALDLDAIITTINKARPERPVTRDHMKSILDSAKTRATVATRGERVTGCSLQTFHRSPNPREAGHLYAMVYVPPEFRSQGIGGALYRALPQKHKLVKGCVNANDIQAVRVVTKAWGCHIEHAHSDTPTELSFALQLARMTPHLFPRHPGVTVSLLSCADFKVISAALYGVYWRGWQEDHQLAPDPAMPPWQWTEVVSQSLAAGGIIAVAFDLTTPVGFTWAIPEGPAMHIEFTTVQEHWRGQGVAKVLKTALCSAAFAAGATRVLTECLSTNTPILATNAALGFDEIVNLEVTQHR